MVNASKGIFRLLGIPVLFISMSISLHSQGTTITTDPPSIQNNPISGQDTSFNQYAVQFAQDLAQQTGLASDKVEELRAILIDYHNEISETRRDFLRGMNDPRSQGDDESRRDVTGGQTGNVNSNMPGGSSGTAGSDKDNTGTTGEGKDNTGTTETGTSGTGNTGTTGTGMSGSGTTGTGSTETGSSGATGSNRSAIEQDLMSEYRKADEKADEKILDVFENDSQKEKYVQIKRQWWQSVKDVVYSTANENSGATETR